MCINIDNGILFSHKKNRLLSFAVTWMDLEDIINQTERQMLYHITYTWNLKIHETSEYNKKKSRLTDIENKYSGFQ